MRGLRGSDGGVAKMKLRMGFIEMGSDGVEGMSTGMEG